MTEETDLSLTTAGDQARFVDYEVSLVDASDLDDYEYLQEMYL